ncbi:hypothetical protein ACFYWX_42560 [Streptomyces sp. NPDC002888]|uniref:hypothetical protein n=1 Tax=Streptomyces sp. NPDC002888 TaxID=3364668 RepID=UPI003685B92E
MSQNNEAGETSASPSSLPSVPRFAMPQAFVILGFVAATVVLALVARMTVPDIVTLLTAAGGISVVVLLAANVRNGGGGGARLLRRLVRAAVGPGSGN